MVQTRMQPSPSLSTTPALPPKRHKAALLTWVGIWPTITLVLWLLLPSLLPRLPLPLLTLCVTAIVVPLMSYVVMPFLFRRFDGWLRR